MNTIFKKVNKHSLIRIKPQGSKVQIFFMSSTLDCLALLKGNHVHSELEELSKRVMSRTGQR
jgi:hypothetical protein